MTFVVSGPMALVVVMVVALAAWLPDSLSARPQGSAATVAGAVRPDRGLLPEQPLHELFVRPELDFMGAPIGPLQKDSSLLLWQQTTKNSLALAIIGRSNLILRMTEQLRLQDRHHEVFLSPGKVNAGVLPLGWEVQQLANL